LWREKEKKEKLHPLYSSENGREGVKNKEEGVKSNELRSKE
jgi:hypothetical protein